MRYMGDIMLCCRGTGSLGDMFAHFGVGDLHAMTGMNGWNRWMGYTGPLALASSSLSCLTVLGFCRWSFSERRNVGNGIPMMMNEILEDRDEDIGNRSKDTGLVRLVLHIVNRRASNVILCLLPIPSR